MKHFENKSQIWFKILSPENTSLDQETQKWSLPRGTKKGDWYTSQSQIGTFLVSNPAPFVMKFNKVYVVELTKEDPLVELPGIIWVRKARLIREATNLDLRRFGIHRTIHQSI